METTASNRVPLAVRFDSPQERTPLLEEVAVRPAESPMTQTGAPRVTTTFPRELWLRLLDEDTESLPCQSPQWVDALCSTGRFVDASRLYDFDGRHFVLPLVARRAPGGRFFAASLPTACEQGGLVGPNRSADVVATVISDLRRSEHLSVHVNPNPSQAAHWAAATQHATEVISKTSHIVDLSEGCEQIALARFSSSARRNVRRAERLPDLEIRVDSTGALVEDFYGLLRLSRARWADAYGSPKLLMQAMGSTYDPKKKLMAMAGHLASDCAFAVAYRDDVPIAGIMVCFGRNAYYTRGAMNRSLVTGVNPNPLLHWRMMQQAVERGCHSYHLGESGESEGLMRFKASLGGEFHETAEYRFEKLPFTQIDRRVRSSVKRIIGFTDNPAERAA